MSDKVDAKLQRARERVLEAARAYGQAVAKGPEVAEVRDALLRAAIALFVQERSARTFSEGGEN